MNLMHWVLCSFIIFRFPSPPFDKLRPDFKVRRRENFRGYLKLKTLVKNLLLLRNDA